MTIQDISREAQIDIPEIEESIERNDGYRSGNCSPRVLRLRRRLIETEPALCVERGMLVTEMYEKHNADPVVLRRARAFAHVLENMTIYINEGELIVGNQASTPRAAPLFPEFLVDFLVQEMNREANTIGSKANDIEITNKVLEIKSEIEKIREQVQNIE